MNCPLTTAIPWDCLPVDLWIIVFRALPPLANLSLSAVSRWLWKIAYDVLRPLLLKEHLVYVQVDQKGMPISEYSLLFAVLLSDVSTYALQSPLGDRDAVMRILSRKGQAALLKQSVAVFVTIAALPQRSSKFQLLHLLCSAGEHSCMCCLRAKGESSGWNGRQAAVSNKARRKRKQQEKEALKQLVQSVQTDILRTASELHLQVPKVDDVCTHILRSKHPRTECYHQLLAVFVYYAAVLNTDWKVQASLVTLFDELNFQGCSYWIFPHLFSYQRGDLGRWMYVFGNRVGED